ncbi:MAG: cell division protein FtsQ/DivIB [Flavisolibacter sp.]
MKQKRVIGKVLIIAAWFLVISGITSLLVAANNKQKEHVCKEVSISILGTGDKFYIQEDDIRKQIERSGGGTLIHRPVTTIDLGKLERALKTNPWIYNAQLYFNNRDILNIRIKEREPIARVFTQDGNSFYLDSSGQRMPLLEKISARVPAITGFTSSKKLFRKDSAVLKEVTRISNFIYANEFWNAQIGEIHITDDQKFELTPVIGDHIIKIGSSDNIDSKLNKLLVFYKQVLSKTGFNKYAILDVQFDGQVIGVKNGPATAVDSIQLKKNIDELLHHANIQYADEGIQITKENSNFKKDTVLKNINLSLSDSIHNETNGRDDQSNSAKTTDQSKPKEEPVTKGQEKKPKALMKRLNH